MAKSGKKISHLQTKIGDTNLNRKKRLGLQRNLIFNQGIKNSWVFEVVVVGGGENAEKVAYLWKNPGYAPD